MVGTNKSPYLKKEGTVYAIEYMKHHENYSRIHDDIGLIRVSETIKFNDKVDKIALQFEAYNEDGVSATLTGWGISKVKILHLTDKY